jgi:predicted metal-dependent hydrolase
MSDGAIIDFVRGRRSWIDGHQRRMVQARERSVVNGAIGGAGALGNGHNGNDVTGSDNRDNGLDGSSGNNDARNATVLEWTAELRACAAGAINAQLPDLLAKWEPIVGRAPSHITLRAMTSRWGSCTPKTGRIRLNLQLGLMEPRFLEYVLVHELTHLWESGHGAGFQRRMTAYLPNWRQLRRELNQRMVL